MIVLKWLIKGWVELPAYRDFHYGVKKDQTVILGKPTTLRDVDVDLLIGKEIIAYNSYYGSYGMGGPGFLGFVFEDSHDILVYAVWGSAQYTLVDGRILACHPRHYQEFNP